MTKYFVFDTETGGKTTKTSLLSVYGIITDERFNEYRDGRIDFKIKPDNGIYNIDVEALKVNSIDLVKHDAQAKPLSQVRTEFRNLISRCAFTSEKIVPVGHCIDFDIKFAEKYLMPDDWSCYFEKRNIDTASVALFLRNIGILPANLSCSLASLVDHFGIDLRAEVLHDAKVDALACLEVWKKMSNLCNGPKSIPLI